MYVICWSPKDACDSGKFGGGVGCVSVLKDCFLQCIDVFHTIFANIASNQPVDDLMPISALQLL